MCSTPDSLELKWGIVGCGLISHDFLKAMKNSTKHHKVVAIADDNIDQAENFKKKLELCDETRAYGSFQELFEDPSVGKHFNTNSLSTI
uniref:Trans-1,2-dihydrobenzene-1,2-diol dehydrogenase n=1 Tax=Acrobeloides nanus TaxID=290746 RepID=A0A914CLK5_9BILA